MRFLAVSSALAIAAAFAAAAARTNAAGSQQRLVVPRGDFLVSDRFGRLLVLDGRGKLVRRLARFVAGHVPHGIELASDRRHAFVSIQISERPARLYEVDLATGRKHKLANAISPALSPDRTRLAYVSTELRGDIVDRTALVVRDLRTGQSRSIPLRPDVPLGTPPELVINWSPDGQRVAVFDGSRIRLVDIATAGDVWSQPGVPGDTAGAPSQIPLLAPVFLDASTLVVLADCCIGRQHLVAVDLRSGARTPFAGLSSPVENIRRLKPGLLLTVTALNELELVSRHHARVIARRIAAAAG